MQCGQRRDQRAHACRDPDGDVQHVVDHQGRGGQQAEVGPEIVLATV
jgi:hypothetical protein